MLFSLAINAREKSIDPYTSAHMQFRKTLASFFSLLFNILHPNTYRILLSRGLLLRRDNSYRFKN